MSKKVLNYAGKRPMLLALIVMATFTLGLLFSGWLTPTPGRAQQNPPNPQPNGENTNCPPVWGSWQADSQNLPTISITFAAPGDQCVQIPAGSTSGSVSVSAGSPTTVDGGKFQVDTSSCSNANNTGTLSITPGKTTWTASGCGTTPSQGNTETAKFTVNAVGSCTVTFTAHGTTTDPSGNYDSSAALQTFNVWLLNGNAPTIPAPQQEASVSLAPSETVSAVKGITWWADSDGEMYKLKHSFSGTVNEIVGSLTYNALSGYAPGVPTGCNMGLTVSFTPSKPGSLDVSLFGVISLGSESVGVTIPKALDIKYTFGATLQPQPPSFFLPPSSDPHKRIWATIYQRTATPNPTTANGTDTWELDEAAISEVKPSPPPQWSVASTGSTSINGSVSFINQSFPDILEPSSPAYGDCCN